ncbi:MAG TPA: MATE family efflux transporter [Euryarchaeota archaeon]|nr:MATE family efflux transporter [Euryarchaeota archaeon]
MKRTIHDKILKGGIIVALFSLGWPMMVSSFLQSAYNLTDTFWVGRLGEQQGANAIASLQMTWPIVWLMIALGMGFGIAGLALVSQYIGAKKPEEANKAAGQVYFLFFTFSFIVAIVGVLVTPTLNRYIIPNEEVREMATLYMRVIFLGQPFMFSVIAFDFLLRGYGDTKTPMYVTAVSVVLNIILDPILMFGIPGTTFSGFGFIGAAYATFLTRSLVSIIAVYLIFSGRLGITLTFENLKPDWNIISKIIKIGIPSSLGGSGAAFGFVIMMFMVARVGDGVTSLAAYGIGDRIISIMFIIISGLQMSLSTIVGQNLGAGNIERAGKAARTAMVMMASLLALGALGIWVFREPLLSIFTTNSAVIDEGILFIGIFGLFMPFFGVFQAVQGVYSGSGHTVYSMGLMIVRLWVLRVPLSYLFAFVFGWDSVGLWWAMGLSNFGACIVAVIIFFWGKWKTPIIKDEPEPIPS